jgi:hypothetical protein
MKIRGNIWDEPHIANAIVSVYRLEIDLEIEKYDGTEIISSGPFNTRVYSKKLTPLCNRYTDTISGYPVEPEEDGIPKFYNGLHYSGFIDFNGFCFWVGNRFAVCDLIEAGFTLSEYHVARKHVQKGKTQVAFVLKEATRVRTYEYFELMDKLADIQMNVDEKSEMSRSYRRQQRKQRREGIHL